MKEEKNAAFDIKAVAEDYIPEFGSVYRRRMLSVQMDALNGELERFRAGEILSRRSGSGTTEQQDAGMTDDARNGPASYTKGDIRQDAIRRAQTR